MIRHAEQTDPNATPSPCWSTTSPASWRASIGLFSGRGYNIESLTVAEVDAERAPLAHHRRHHAARRW